MKTSLRLLFLFMLMLTFLGCKTKKSIINDNTVEKGILYKQALMALGEHKFIIKAYEFHFPDDAASVKTSSGSYISMQGKQAFISFTPDIFPRNPFSNLNIKDNAASLTSLRSKKNGELRFCLKIDGDKNWLRRKILIILYPNTNECFVQVNNDVNSNIINFKGEIFPIKE